MWPKMLFELLPHVGRVIPMAERFFATRGMRDQEEQAALQAIAENLRIELGKVSETQAGVQRTLAEQGQTVGAVAAEVALVRTGVESVGARLGKLEGALAAVEESASRAEKAASRMAGMFVAMVVLLLVVAIGMAVVLFRVWGR